MGSNRSRRMLHRMYREERDRLAELAGMADEQPRTGTPELTVTAGLASADAATGSDEDKD
jgi:hypothetical protein